MNVFSASRRTALPRKQIGLFEMSFVAWVALAIALLVVGASVCWYFVAPKLIAAEAKADLATKTLGDERKVVLGVIEASDKAAVELKKLKEKSNATDKKLIVALARSADCSLGADVGRVLRSQSDGPAATASAASESVGAAPRTEVDPGGREGNSGSAIEASVSCKAITEWGQANFNRVKENAVQVRGLQDAYDKVREASVQASQE